MPPLAELQQRFARAVLGGAVPTGLFTGRVPVAEALSIHRDIVIGALAGALRLCYPTVDALVGTDFFDHAARNFAQNNPPRLPSLAVYGEGFAGFLAAFVPGLPYLPDVARLDRAIETTLNAPAEARHFALDGAAAIALPASLAVLRLAHPADEIRAALESHGGDDAALAAIDMTQGERFVLVWRKGEGAAVQRVSLPAGRFLAALLDGADAQAAFAAALAAAPQAQALHAIQADIFAAAFCTVMSEERPS